MFTEGVIDILDRALSWARWPKRNSKGAVQWKRLVLHVAAQLAWDIGQKADTFVEDVYALPGVHTKELKSDEAGHAG